MLPEWFELTSDLVTLRDHGIPALSRWVPSPLESLMIHYKRLSQLYPAWRFSLAANSTESTINPDGPVFSQDRFQQAE